MLPGLLAGSGGPPGLPGLSSPPSPEGDQSFSVGMLAGLGLREFSQLFGLSKSGKSASQQPSASSMLQGNMGDIDRQMVLAEMLKRQAPSGPPPGMGTPMGAGLPPGLPAGGPLPSGLPGMPPGMAGPPMMPPGMPPGMPGMAGPPMLPPGMPGPGVPPPQQAQPGGPVASALLQQLLSKAMSARQGLV